MLDSIPAILIDEFGETRKPNSKMCAILEDGLIALNTSRQLKFPGDRDNDAFAKLLTQAFIGQSLPKRYLMHFQLQEHAGPNVLEIHKLPAPICSGIQLDHDCLPDKVSAMITIRCRHLLVLPTPAEIQDALGVSPMEALAVHGLVEGLTAEEQAELRGAAAETVRWHVKNVYVRLHCAGRAELVQLVLGLTRTTFD